MSKGVKERRIQRTQAQWAQVISEQAESGLTQEVFCERHDVGLGAFGKAKRQLSRVGDVRSLNGTSEFVSVPVEPTLSGQWEVELSVGRDVVIRIRGL